MPTLSNAVIKGYQSDVFQGLDAFHLAKRSLAKQEQCITLLGDVICDHNMQKHVGVSLLHKHFSISSDEIVVKRFVDNVAYIEPHKIDIIEDELPYIWRVKIDGNMALYYPTEFCQFPAHLRKKAAV